MTEYELVDALNSTVSVLVETLSVYVAVSTAYLVCAYVVGDRLTTSQCTVISVLYLVSAGVGTFAMFSMGSHASELARAIEEINPAKSFGMKLWVRDTLIVICACGLPACLKFMWDIRHPKADRMPGGDLHRHLARHSHCKLG